MTRLSRREVVERVAEIERTARQGLPWEDSLVELKSRWIAPAKAARLIAAQANAAAPHDCLWVIGMKDRQGPVTVDDVPELSAWVSEVRSHFDGPMPRVTDFRLSALDGTPLTVLAFATDEVPYVVEVARESGGVRARDILWREGTSVRSATRTELMRLLFPLASAPDISARNATLYIHDRLAPETNIMLHVQLRVTPRARGSLVLPFDRQLVELQVNGISYPLREVEVEIPVGTRRAPLLDQGDSELVVSGATNIEVCAQGHVPAQTFDGATAMEVVLTLVDGHGSQTVPLRIPFVRRQQAEYAHCYDMPGRPWDAA